MEKALRSSKLRSIDANAYYWKIIIPHSKEALIDAGYEREKFNHRDKVHRFWKKTLNIDTTTTLTTTQFSDYIEDIIRICAVYLNYQIPD